MQALTTASSVLEYNELCNLLASKMLFNRKKFCSNHALASEESEAVRNWAQHKKSPVIAAGICRACSNMSKEVWNTLSSDTNASEQAGMMGYKTGIRVSLLEAVRK